MSLNLPVLAMLGAVGLLGAATVLGAVIVFGRMLRRTSTSERPRDRA